MKTKDTNQLSFSLPEVALPPANLFPLNEPRQEENAEHFIKQDFSDSEHYLVVTGFSSLDYLVRFFDQKKDLSSRKIQIVLGNEPMVSEGRRRYFKDRLDEEIKDYWLEKGISIVYGGHIIHLIELIKSGVVEFRYLNNLHGKLYVGDTYAMLGSSNFSWSGLRKQLEANKRCEKGTEDYEAIRQIAQFYYGQAKSYNKQMIELLEQLLRCVSWQEALSRAIAELVEGDWIKKYPQAFSNLEEFNLWGVQVQAIGQALYILDNHGSLLVADPTGAGKTRLGVALKLALLNRLWMKGRGHRSRTLLLCPSAVRNNWQREADQVYYNNLNIVTHSQLSDRKNAVSEMWRNQLTKTNILFIDEAHNFLRTSSKRSRNIKLNNADHIILLTATPINKKEEDLFRLIEIMDVDNLSEDVIEKFEAIRKSRRNLVKEDVETFRKVLRNFTIRRTKKDLNKIIDRNPEQYLNRLGQRCRFPFHKCLTYTLNESSDDIAIMEKINELVKELKGLNWLRRLWLKEHELQDDELQEKIVHGRIKAAAGLSAYHVQNRIRSSRAALIEHIHGTKKALEFAGLPKVDTDKEGGDMISKLKVNREQLPKTNATVSLPQWMTELEIFQKACDREISIYEQILVLAHKMSGQREERKARHLAELLKKHDLLLAFDSRLISLHYIRKLIKDLGRPINTMVVTGEGGKRKKEKALDVFGLESRERGWIGLCSDAMAEGVNMQRASVLVFLDMPSVMRLAEQRIGRIDRMDSPHKEIEIYWVDDHDAFALRADQRFFKTAQVVQEVIGSNIELPDKFTQEIIKAQAAIDLHMDKQENEERYSDGIQDAFRHVRRLIQEPDPLVLPSTYEEIRNSKASVFSHVSFVASRQPFGFFALKGTERTAPRWLLIEHNGKITTDLNYICEQLPTYLEGVEDQSRWTDTVSKLMDHFIGVLKKSQIENLPNKKRRGLELLRRLIGHHLYKNQFSNIEEKSRMTRLQGVLNLDRQDESASIDYYQMALDWLDIVQPVLNEERQKSRRSLIHLGNCDRYLRRLPISELHLEDLENKLLLINPLDKRIAACIIGVPESNEFTQSGRE